MTASRILGTVAVALGALQIALRTALEIGFELQPEPEWMAIVAANTLIAVVAIAGWCLASSRESSRTRPTTPG